MPHVSQRLANVCESQTVALNSLMAKMRREGKDVVALGAGEPDFDTPDFIKEEAIAAIRQGFTKYTPADGILELREAVCNWLKDEYNADYQANEVIITNGAKHAVYEGILAVVDPGDEVLLPAPYWVSYPEQIKMAGGVEKILDTKKEDGYKITPQQLEKAITSKTRLLILNSPNNPSGAVYSEAELAGLAAVIKKTGIYVLSDEIYDTIIYDQKKFTSMIKYREIRDQLLLVNGVSKSFAMTGWRIGYLAAHKDIVNAVKRYQGHSTSNPTSVSQKAALAGLLGKKDFLAVMNKAFTERRNYVHQRLTAIPGVSCMLPQGAFYAFPDFSFYYGKKGIQGSNDLCSYLLEQFNVALVPGMAFGMENNTRLSFATSMQALVKALDRIENGLKSLL